MLYIIFLFVNISIVGPRQNKTLIRFVTDCLKKFVVSVKSIEGSAPPPPTPQISVKSQYQT